MKNKWDVYIKDSKGKITYDETVEATLKDINKLKKLIEEDFDNIQVITVRKLND